MRRLGLVLVAIVLSGCKSAPLLDPPAARGSVHLAGTYGVQRGGELEPVLKVEETRAGYQFEERVTGEWRVDSAVPHVLSEDEAKRVLGRGNVSFPVFGLGTDSALLLEAPANWRSMPDVPVGPGAFAQVAGDKREYVLMTGGERFPARKVEMGSR